MVTRPSGQRSRARVDNLRQRFLGHTRIVLKSQRFHAVAEVVIAHFAGEGNHRAVFIAFGQPEILLANAKARRANDDTSLRHISLR